MKILSPLLHRMASRPGRRNLLAAALSVGMACLVPGQAARAAEALQVIRIGTPELGSGTHPFPGGNPLSVLKARGWLEDEFKADHIRVEWTTFRGAGPAVNEALAAKQLDLVFLGDLASVIGKSRGLPTRLIAVVGRNSNSYLAVAPGSDIKGFADLKGRKVSVLKGTAYQRPFDAFLAEAGLTERDLKVVNLDWPGSKAAVANHDIDATFGGADLHLLTDKGVTLPVSTKGKGPAFSIYGSLLATQDFIDQYPQHTARIVRQLVRASQWASEEGNRAALLQLWGEQSGQGEAVFKADFEGESLKARHSPRIDEAAVTVYKQVVADGLRLGLIRQGVDVDAWVAPQFVEAALKELKLEKYWPLYDRNGRGQP
ncbi:MAG: ABC transporter substrate-binding protein [Curvibacter sp.]|nr:ABC transporter substrate-binding protein [Curvibacter sp.]